MKIDLQLLERCDLLLVLTLDGWQESVGVSMEIAEAKRLGIPIVYLSEEDLLRTKARSTQRKKLRALCASVRKN